MKIAANALIIFANRHADKLEELATTENDAHRKAELIKMADEKGRGITMSELAEHMKISEDEILDIIKLAGEEMYDKFKEYKDN